jgi:Terminase large subunit, T4likevirus-type, N-terminal
MLIARDLAHSLDPTLLAADVGVACDPWQSQLLRSLRPGGKILMLCCRQSGKTTCAALMGLHTMLYQPGSTTLIASPSQEQSNELLDRVKKMHAALEDAPELEGDAVKRIKCRNDSRVIALAGEQRTARGKTADLVVVDEAAQIDPEMWAALRPTLATTNGCLVVLSTPKGQNNKFSELWHEANEPEWTKVRVSVDRCPRITEDFKRSELKELGPTLYGQEYLLDFVADEMSAFNLSIIEMAFDPTVRPLWH